MLHLSKIELTVHAIKLGPPYTHSEHAAQHSLASLYWTYTPVPTYAQACVGCGNLGWRRSKKRQLSATRKNALSPASKYTLCVDSSDHRSTAICHISHCTVAVAVDSRKENWTRLIPASFAQNSIRTLLQEGSATLTPCRQNPPLQHHQVEQGAFYDCLA